MTFKRFRYKALTVSPPCLRRSGYAQAGESVLAFYCNGKYTVERTIKGLVRNNAPLGIESQGLEILTG